ncbi:protein translocase subunit SecF [Campylobacter geochelonis]|uniref:Protein-export membrane protein SecF n=1 Tax=Campylobacter geochelonis TaxID=1780362 RepID=A0A128EN86_9BACT|nr:protein translocase subunit SecF [Campylobacter geochelonis]QKF70981.1 protein-export membrane protein SecF [Campylobacter geochelonis]CZE47089.1 preprotein translocase subunit SecF [Campylobacter geochelonis]CZE47573.1 preprotein translocase subunit SecF [Campylobacter geochelonis]CZE50203.1 preprotein translocase subunit SecF [Campylobacter geochelonis]
MQIFDKNKIYDFMGYRHVVLAISVFLMVGSMFLFFTKGFNYGIDFSGGTLIQIKYEGAAPLDDIRKKLESVEALKGASVTEFGSSDEVTIRYSGSSDSLGVNPGASVSKILEGTGKFEIRRVDVVGPKVGDDLRKSGIMALSVSLLLILIYIAFRFEWRFALAAIASEIHDVIITVGAIIFFNIDVNLDTLAAVLTIVGYSLNDTIIVFDRIREGVQESKESDMKHVINEAVSRTLSRTILTSFTTLISVVILFFYGGDMIYGFSLIMLVGVLVGTASSVFIAAQALVWLKFNVVNYRASLAEKKRKAKEKEKMRSMYEKGMV